MEDPENSLATPGGAWAVPDEGIGNSGAVQGRKGQKAEGRLARAFSSLEGFSCPSEFGSLAGPGGSWRDKMSFPGHSHLSTQ